MFYWLDYIDAQHLPISWSKAWDEQEELCRLLELGLVDAAPKNETAKQKAPRSVNDNHESSFLGIGKTGQDLACGTTRGLTAVLRSNFPKPQL